MKRDLFKDFQDLVRVYFISRNKPMWADLIKKQFGLEDGIPQTLADIGRRFNFTRERARQISAMVLNDLKKLMEGKTIDLMHIYCEAPEDVSAYKAFKEGFKDRRLLTLVRVEKGFPGCCMKDQPYYKNWLDFLMVVFGYEAAEYEKAPLYYRDYIYADIMSRVARLRHFLRNQSCYTSGLVIMKTLCMTAEEFTFFLGFMEGLEETTIKGVRCYRLVVKELIGTSVVIHRVLYEHGSPMHIKDINEAMDKMGWDRHVYPIGFILKRAKNLRAIGKSGMWALKSWGMDTSNIWEILERVLKKADKPLSVGDLVWKAGVFREISEGTAQSIMCTYGKIFVRYKSGKYGLKEWKALETLETPRKGRGHYTYKQPFLKDKVVEEAVAILKSRGSMTLKSLREEIMKKGQYTSALVYGTLNRKDLFEKKKIDVGRSCTIALK